MGVGRHLGHSRFLGAGLTGRASLPQLLGLFGAVAGAAISPDIARVPGQESVPLSLGHPWWRGSVMKLCMASLTNLRIGPVSHGSWASGEQCVSSGQRLLEATTKKPQPTLRSPAVGRWQWSRSPHRSPRV